MIKQFFNKLLTQTSRIILLIFYVGGSIFSLRVYVDNYTDGNFLDGINVKFRQNLGLGGSSHYVAMISDDEVPSQVVSNPFYEDSEEEKVEEVVEASDLVENDSSEEDSSSVVAVSTVSNNWVWPTNGGYYISSYYGYRWGSLHDAIDITGTGYGSNIMAANSGVVDSVHTGCTKGYTRCNGGGGNYVVIRHDIGDYYTVYMHLKDVYVGQGQTVVASQVIGTMGNTGNVVPVPTSSNPYEGTHLHFAVYRGRPYQGGVSLNPLSLY